MNDWKTILKTVAAAVRAANDKAHAIVRMWLELDDAIPPQEQRDRLVEDIRDAIIAATVEREPAPDAETLAKRFHEAYERLAPQFGYETRKDSAVPWAEVPERNRKLMVAVCAELAGAVEREGAQREAALEEAAKIAEEFPYSVHGRNQCLTGIEIAASIRVLKRERTAQSPVAPEKEGQA